MGAEGLLVVVLTFAVLILLVLEKASLDAIGVGLLIVLVASGELFRIFDPNFDPAERLLSLDQALQSFGNYAVITIAALYVVGEGLNRTGAVEFLARVVLRYSNGRERRMILLIGLIAAAVSSVLNNTGVVVVFIPVLLGMSRTTGVAPSRLLIPLSFASILGGMCTLVGTSTNLLVSGAAENLGHRPLEMFEMSALGVPLTIVGIAFMAVFGRKLLPVRASTAVMVGGPGSREYVTELLIGPTSSLVGKKYSEAFAAGGADLMFFVRGEEMHWPPFYEEVIQPDDVVMLRGGVDELANLQARLGLRLVNDVKFDPHTMQFFEIAVAPHSGVVGRQIGELHLWRDYNAVVVAVLREGRHIRERASELILRPGDLLLVCGEEHAEARLRASSDFFLLYGAHDWIVLRDRGRRALGIAGMVVVLFSLYSVFGIKIVPLPFAALLGAMAMVATGCLTPRRAYRAIDWPILIFVIGTLALGKAMNQTGAAAFFASGIVSSLQELGPVAVASGLVFLCIVFNALISHSAVAVLLTPIAIEAAQAMIEAEGVAPGSDRGSAIMRAFILAIAFGGSICFATPIGHQTNLMVYGPGGYRYSDFLRLGLPLSLIAWVMVSLGLPLLVGL